MKHSYSRVVSALARVSIPLSYVLLGMVCMVGVYQRWVMSSIRSKGEINTLVGFRRLAMRDDLMLWLLLALFCWQVFTALHHKSNRLALCMGILYGIAIALRLFGLACELFA